MTEFFRLDVYVKRKKKSHSLLLLLNKHLLILELVAIFLKLLLIITSLIYLGSKFSCFGRKWGVVDCIFFSRIWVSLVL